VLDAGPRAGEREPVQQDGRQVRVVPRGAWRGRRRGRLAQALRQEVQPEAHRAAQPRQHRQEQPSPLIQFCNMFLEDFHEPLYAPWNRTYIYRLLCGRNSGLQGMISQLLLFGTVDHQSLYDSLLTSSNGVQTSRIDVRSSVLRGSTLNQPEEYSTSLGGGYSAGHWIFFPALRTPQAICGYNGGKSKLRRLTLTPLLNIGRQFILTAFDIHYYLKQKCCIP
jgi:hypothetical protein